jgi:hypothetical protein
MKIGEIKEENGIAASPSQPPRLWSPTEKRHLILGMNICTCLSLETGCLVKGIFSC